MKNKIILSLVFLAAITCSFTSTAQGKEAALAAADTSFFSVNKAEGWQLYNSYAAMQGEDSVNLEFIVQHERNINFGSNVYMGKIKDSSLFPQSIRIAQFNLINTVFEVTIETDGKCYLRLVSGTMLEGDPLIVPAKVVYKK